MTRDEARDEIKNRWRELYRADRGHGDQAGIICPLCGNGEGSSGTGIRPWNGHPGKLHCFKCGFSGDIFDLLQQDGATPCTDYNSALQYAAERLGLRIDQHGDDWAEWKAQHPGNFKKTAAPAADQGKQPAADQTKPAFLSLQAAQEYFYTCVGNLWKSPAALEYVRGRGLGEDVLVNYGVGYDQNSDPAGTGYPTPRIIIPSDNTQSMHYTARAISDDAQIKKMNPKGVPVDLFNTRALWRGQACFIVEGALDALSVLEVGGQAVGLNSTANAGKLLQLLQKRPTKSPLIVCTDNDEAGNGAALLLTGKAKDKTTGKPLPGLESVGATFITWNISGSCKDPNEALTTNREQFRAAVGAAIRAAEEKAAQAIEEEKNRHILPVKDFAESFQAHREKYTKNLRTGFLNLDKTLGGGFTNELYTLTAETSTGKSAIASVIAQNIAQAGTPVLYYALEMSKDEFIARGASAISKEMSEAAAVFGGDAQAIKYGEILNETFDERTGKFYKRPYSQYAKYVAEYMRRYGDNLYFIEGGINGRTARSIADDVRKFKQEHSAGRVCVVVDYMQLLTADPDDREQRDPMTKMSAAVKTLKALASQEGAAVLALSSMANDKTGQRVDVMSGKYSGDIGFTAGVALGWNWDGVTNVRADDKDAETGRPLRDLNKERDRARGFRVMLLDVLKNRSNDRDTTTRLQYYPAFNYIIENTDAGAIGWNDPISEAPAPVKKETGRDKTRREYMAAFERAQAKAAGGPVSFITFVDELGDGATTKKAANMIEELAIDLIIEGTGRARTIRKGTPEPANSADAIIEGMAPQTGAPETLQNTADAAQGA